MFAEFIRVLRLGSLTLFELMKELTPPLQPFTQMLCKAFYNMLGDSNCVQQTAV